MSKKSVAITLITYDVEREDLTIKFKNGKEYVYTPVSSRVVDNFKTAASKGTFFNNQIKDNPTMLCLKKVK